MPLILKGTSARYGEFTVPTVDMSNIRDFYNNNFVGLGILDNCNGQEYRLIDGYGKGFFLVANRTVTLENPDYDPECDPEHVSYNPMKEDCPEIVTPEVAIYVKDLFVDTSEVELVVYNNESAAQKIVPERKIVRFVKSHGTSITSMDFDNDQIPLIVIETAEDKQIFKSKKARRNYNILQACNVDSSSGSPSVSYEDPESTPKTLYAILNDLLNPFGYTLATTYFDADLIAIIPNNITVDHLDTLEAIDYICRAYNFGWSSYSNGTKVIVLPFTDETNSFLNEAECIEHQSDNIQIEEDIEDYNEPYELLVYFRIWYKPGSSFRSKKPNYYVIGNRTGTDDKVNGRTLKHYFPFEYAHFQYEEDIADNQSNDPANLDVLQEIYDDILARCKAGNVVKRYEYQKFVATTVDRPMYILDKGFHHHSVIYRDFGDVHTTLFDSVIYPFLPVPPTEEIHCNTVSGGKIIQGNITDVNAGTVGEQIGFNVIDLTVVRASCDAKEYIGQSVKVVDWSGCIADLDPEDLEDVWLWACDDWQENPDFDDEKTIENPDYVPECDPENVAYDPEHDPCPEIVTPTIPNPNYDPRTHICGWATLNRCCPT